MSNFEKCCICGEETTVPFDMLIENRVGYMEGAGQLCEECYRSVLYPERKERAQEDRLTQAVLNASRQQ